MLLQIGLNWAFCSTVLNRAGWGLYTIERARLPAPKGCRTDSDLKTIGVLLFAYGVVAALAWGTMAAMAIAVGGMAGADPVSVEFLLVIVAPFIAFCSYPWVVVRSLRRRTVLIWGIVAHLPVLGWVSRIGQAPQIAMLSGVLLLGMALYGLYAWLACSEAGDAHRVGDDTGRP